jgi:hypothetical protein
MPRVEHQLREYFDAGVERLTAEDVIAQAAVRNGDLEPMRERRTFRPAWAAAAAFVLTLVVFGGAFVVLDAIERGGSEAGSGGLGGLGSAPAAPGSGGVWIWPAAAVSAGGVAALAAWLTRRRPRLDVKTRDEGKVRIVETMERIEEIEAPKPGGLERRNRWLVITVAVLFAIAAGLSAWLALQTRPVSPNAAPADVQQLMEDYAAAWNAQDASALAALVSPGYRIHSDDPQFDFDLAGVRSTLMPALAVGSWQTTDGGPYYAVGGAGMWFVSGEGATITASLYADGDGLTNNVWRVVTRDGRLLVEDHFFYGSSDSGRP